MSGAQNRGSEPRTFICARCRGKGCERCGDTGEIQKRRMAYADPPYPGQAHLYKEHPDYAGEVDHPALVERLVEEFPDGWALSTSVPALRSVFPLCPEGVRLCAWTRGVVPRPPARIMWCWEPLIVYVSDWRQRHRHDFVRDTLHAMQPTGFLGNQLPGQKPDGFCSWVFDLLGLTRDDELVDLFPGSGAVGLAWEKWTSQSSIFEEDGGKFVTPELLDALEEIGRTG